MGYRSVDGEKLSVCGREVCRYIPARLIIDMAREAPGCDCDGKEILSASARNRQPCRHWWLVHATQEANGADGMPFDACRIWLLHPSRKPSCRTLFSLSSLSTYTRCGACCVIFLRAFVLATIGGGWYSCRIRHSHQCIMIHTPGVQGKGVGRALPRKRNPRACRAASIHDLLLLSLDITRHYQPRNPSQGCSGQLQDRFTQHLNSQSCGRAPWLT